MKIVLTGGGTGGHITPLLAVAEQLKTKRSDCETVYIGERKTKFAALTVNTRLFDTTHQIYVGKFRRYHGLSWWRKLVDVKTSMLNLRDSMYVVIGTIQAWLLLGRVKPDVVFLKGGFVGVPVGLAAAARHIPIITHDSDALPGLANRVVSRWVRLHAVALPPQNYPYPPAKTKQVGVLVEAAYKPVTLQTQREYKKQIGIPVKNPLLLITGASSGAIAINEAVVQGIDGLLQEFPELYVVHQVGKGKAGVYGSYVQERLTILEFLTPMYAYMGAADVVVTRGSGNTLAELGVQGKPAIVVPSPYLANGHQLKNAEALKEQGSALVVEEKSLYDQQQGLIPAIRQLLTSDKTRQQLARNLQANTLSGAADRLSSLIIAEAETAAMQERSK